TSLGLTLSSVAGPAGGTYWPKATACRPGRLRRSVRRHGLRTMGGRCVRAPETIHTRQPDDQSHRADPLLPVRHLLWMVRRRRAALRLLPGPQSEPNPKGAASSKSDWEDGEHEREKPEVISGIHRQPEVRRQIPATNEAGYRKD